MKKNITELVFGVVGGIIGMGFLYSGIRHDHIPLVLLGLVCLGAGLMLVFIDGE